MCKNCSLSQFTTNNIIFLVLTSKRRLHVPALSDYLPITTQITIHCSSLLPRPERFLEKTDAGGWKLVKHERFVPYGFGRRMCMGQTMAKNTLFIVFATLLKHLKFDAPTAHPLPSPTNCTYGFISMPMPFYVNIKVIPKERPRP